MASQGQTNVNVPRPRDKSPVPYPHQSSVYSPAMNKWLAQPQSAGPFDALASIPSGQPGSANQVVYYAQSNNGATYNAPNVRGNPPNTWAQGYVDEMSHDPRKSSTN